MMTEFGSQRRGRPDGRSLFDRFAGWAADFAGHATFFIGCLLLVVLWAPSYFLLQDLNTWQLIINTVTTIITFLLVALLQNSQRRGEQALHTKLDALADGLADLMEHVGGAQRELAHDVDDLRQSVAIERRR
jgi:low affinity Fe/Cu permease